MLRKLLPLMLLIPGACSGSGPEADLQYIKQARSLGAEWALVNEHANKRHLNGIYVRSMHRWLRLNLRTSLESLTEPNSAYATEIKGLLSEPDAAAPGKLRAHVEALKQIEDHLESA